MGALLLHPLVLPALLAKLQDKGAAKVGQGRHALVACMKGRACRLRVW